MPAMCQLVRDMRLGHHTVCLVIRSSFLEWGPSYPSNQVSKMQSRFQPKQINQNEEIVAVQQKRCISAIVFMILYPFLIHYKILVNTTGQFSLVYTVYMIHYFITNFQVRMII